MKERTIVASSAISPKYLMQGDIITPSNGTASHEIVEIKHWFAESEVILKNLETFERVAGVFLHTDTVLRANRR